MGTKTIQVDQTAGGQQILIGIAVLTATIFIVLAIVSVTFSNPEIGCFLWIGFAIVVAAAAWWRGYLAKLIASGLALIISESGLTAPKWDTGEIPWAAIRRITLDNVFGEDPPVRVRAENARVIQIFADDDEKYLRKTPRLRRAYAKTDAALGPTR